MYSVGIKLAKVDDFGHAEECVKPIFIKKDKDEKKRNRIELDDDTLIPPNAPPLEKDMKEQALVSLADCLACSGCVTTAETILVQQQSINEFENVVNTGDKKIIITLSPQSLTSLARHFKLSLFQTAGKLYTFFKNEYKVNYVLDSNFALDFVLLEATEEFISLYNNKKSKKSNDVSFNSNYLPIISSECPGWICYAEKAQGDEIFHHISTVKSPQAVMGTFIKSHFAKTTLGTTADIIYHVAVMPCYDKKLEAFRKDFTDPDTGSRLVDCVLTSGEILEIIKKKNIDFSNQIESPLEPYDLWSISSKSKPEALFCPVCESGASGGYAEYIFRTACDRIFKREISNDTLLPWKIGANIDLNELKLEQIYPDLNKQESLPLLHFIRAYGFRNIQNIVQKIKRGYQQNKHVSFHYVELMACPHGCLNGGGQIKSDKSQLSSVTLKEMDVIYTQYQNREPKKNIIVERLYKEWIKGTIFSEEAHKLLHTTYKPIDKNEQIEIDW